MIFKQAAALARPVGGCVGDGVPRQAVLGVQPRGTLAWVDRGARSLRARCGVAELVLLHRLRAGAPSGVPQEAARVIRLTAQAWLGGALPENPNKAKRL